MKIHGPCNSLLARVVTLSLALLFIGVSSVASAQQFTEWGWPQPYEKISDKSAAWLKTKGWWPINVAWLAPWSGQNAISTVMFRERLLEKRGLEAKFQSFLVGSEINELVTSERVQVGVNANFPFSSLMDRKIPVKVIAVFTPNLNHSLIVPVDSPIKSIKDLKKSNAVIGLSTGSSGEFYFQTAAEVNGIEIGKDVILKNMTIPDMMLLPKGLSGAVLWDPSLSIITDVRKTGRVVDSIFPYNFFQGNFLVHQQLIENVPDVVQALSDAFIEASLWIRVYPDKAVDYLAEEPRLKNYDKPVLRKQTEIYNNLYPPTASFPYASFWAEENARIAIWLKQNGRLVNTLTKSDYEASFDTRFMTKTFDKVGWKIPSQPPFLPKGWNGSLGKLPYPEYQHALNMTKPIAWPEPGDLTKTWQFNGKTYRP